MHRDKDLDFTHFTEQLLLPLQAHTASILSTLVRSYITWGYREGRKREKTKTKRKRKMRKRETQRKSTLCVVTFGVVCPQLNNILCFGHSAVPHKTEWGRCVS